MPRITRKLQKIFASNASNNGQFGSARAGTKILSQDPDVLQNLPAYLSGWSQATISGDKLPTLEEMQSLDYINTYQLAYLFQEGIPEYNSATTYYTFSIVRETGTYKLYGSLTNDNTGNALSDPTKWTLLVNLADIGLDDGTYGDIQVSSSGTIWTIINNAITTNKIINSAVTNAKLANMGAATIKGNNTGGATAPLDLTTTQVTAMLNAMVGDSGTGGTKGLVPAPGAGDAAANKVLYADGLWKTAPLNRTLLNTQNLSNVATIDLTGMTGYAKYDIEIENMQAITGTPNLNMLVSTNNGSTYLVTSIYNNSGYRTSPGGNTNFSTNNGSPSTAFVMINSSAVSNPLYLNMRLVPTAGQMEFFGYGSFRFSGIYPCAVSVGGWAAAGTVNAIRFLAASGNITGVVRLYGVTT